MKSIFDRVSAQCSKLTTQAYSTSFSIGIYLLNKSIRKPIYGIYGFVRFADEIVDSFHDYDKEALFYQFKADTEAAIRNKISLNPILNSFQEAVHHFNIEAELIETFLNSMEMDLGKEEYDLKSYEQYILGSAEVVGLMCLRIFTNGDEADYQKLKPTAMSLGSAFQKVNFLRDAQADYEGMGRTYFPNIDMKNFNQKDKSLIEKEIRHDFEQALLGIKQLPDNSKLGVYVAYVYYLKLLKKIERLPADRILQERIRVPNFMKFSLMLYSFIMVKLGRI